MIRLLFVTTLLSSIDTTNTHSLIYLLYTYYVAIIIDYLGMNDKSNEKWAVRAHRWITVNDALTPGKYDKYVRLNIEYARQKGLL